MLPPPNPSLLTEANTLPVMRYYATPGTIKLRQSLSQGLLLHDTHCLGAQFIQDNLHLSFPFPQWGWIARELPDNHYFILPPDPSWRDEMINARSIKLVDVTFPVTGYNFHRFNQGNSLRTYWVQIFNFPHDLWRDPELRQLARDLGGVYLDSDVISSMIVLRLKIGVSDKDVIPACKHLVFTETTGEEATYIVQTMVEDFGDTPR